METQPTEDRLEQMWQMQAGFNSRLGIVPGFFTQEERDVWLLRYCLAMRQEIGELVDCVPWKWWAKYQKRDLQNARVEVVDLFHFLISSAQILGMTSDDFFGAYIGKNKVNNERQDSGYVEKNEDDSKHI
jgi:dimeric dUTPase (all-alpha-NTP-PPase superfamily)